MIESIEIENLRGIAHGKLEGLTPLTILVGPNGSGKSTILDAIYFGVSPDSAKALQRIIERHNIPSNPAKWLKNPKSTEKISINIVTNEASIQWETNPSLEINGPKIFFNEIKNGMQVVFPYGGFAGIFRNSIKDTILIDWEDKKHQKPIHELFSRVVEQGKKKTLIKNLEKIIPNIEDLVILTEDSQPMLHILFPDHSVPIQVSGEGIESLLCSGLELITSDNGVVLIEEPEAHLHPAAMQQYAKLIFIAIKNSSQVILTTHSIELIDALLDAATETDNLDKLSVFWVKLDNGELKTIRTPGEDVAFERENLGKDLR